MRRFVLTVVGLSVVACSLKDEPIDPDKATASPVAARAGDASAAARCKAFSESRHKWSHLSSGGLMKDTCSASGGPTYTCEFRGAAQALVQALKTTNPDGRVEVQAFGSDLGNTKFMAKGISGGIASDWLDAAALFLEAQKYDATMPNTLTSSAHGALEGGTNLYAADCSAYADSSLRYTSFHLAMIDVLGVSASSKHAPALRSLLHRSATGEINSIGTYTHEKAARALFFMRERDAAPDIASSLNAYRGTTQEDHRVGETLAVLGAWRAKDAVPWCTAQITEYAPHSEKVAQCAMYLARVGDVSKAPYLLANLGRVGKSGTRALGMMAYAPAKKRLSALAEQGDLDALVALANIGDGGAFRKIAELSPRHAAELRYLKPLLARQGIAALTTLGKSLTPDSNGAALNALVRAQLGDPAGVRDVVRLLQEGDSDVRSALARSMFFDEANGDSSEGEPFYHRAFLPALEKALAVEGSAEAKVNLMFAVLTQRALKK